MVFCHENCLRNKFFDFMWLSRHPRLSAPPYSAPWQSRHSGIHTAYTTSRREHNFCVPYPGQYRGSKKLIIDHRPRVNRPSRSSMNGRIAVQRDQLDQNLAPSQVHHVPVPIGRRPLYLSVYFAKVFVQSLWGNPQRHDVDTQGRMTR